MNGNTACLSGGRPGQLLRKACQIVLEQDLRFLSVLFVNSEVIFTKQSLAIKALVTRTFQLG